MAETNENLVLSADERATEVILLWGGAAQRSDLFRGSFSVRVGEEPDSDYALPLGDGGGFTMLESDGNELLVTVPGRAVGAFATATGRVEIADLPVDGEGMRHCRVPLEAQGLLKVAGFEFLVRGVTAPQKVAAAAPLRLRWRDHRVTVASVGAHLAFVSAMLLVPPGALSLSLDRDQMRSRYIDASVAPDARPEELPEWMQPGPQQGGMEGQPSQGDEGKAGDPDAPRVERRMQVRGRPDNPQPRVPAIGADQVRTAGILGVIRQSSSPMGLLYGAPGAEGADQQTIWGNLMGQEPGPAFGSWGLGMNGTGRGGCPIGAVCTALGTAGMGNGGRLGTFGGCSPERFASLTREVGRARAMEMCSGGNGPPGIGGPDGRGRPPADHTPQVTGRVENVGPGGLSREDIRRVVRLHMAEVRYCYEQGLRARPDLAGRVAVHFVVGAQGRVLTSGVSSSTLGDASVGSCVSHAVQRWSFPAIPTGGVTSVNYPFTFTPAEGRE
ncbi:MAG: energy transducer TonB [Deltaproteobacteria bacterium]|nr:energy transducer TonB [Deltaproteobacteria bacterium]